MSVYLDIILYLPIHRDLSTLSRWYFGLNVTGVVVVGAYE